MNNDVQGAVGAQPNHGNRYRDSLKQLRRMEHVLRMRRKDGPPPRAGLALAATVLVFCALLVCISYADNHLVRTELWTLAAFGTAVVVGLSVNRLSSAPRTHTDHLDALLTAYDPVSRQAFREFRERARDTGALPSELVSEWIAQERAAVQRESGLDRPSEPRFFSRDI